MSKLYGSYAILACHEDDPQELKLDMMKTGICSIMDNMKNADVPLDMNTMQLIVHEGIDVFSSDDTDWYADEKPNYHPALPQYRITVGIKCEQK